MAGSQCLVQSKWDICVNLVCLAGLILEWRRISSALSKVVFPLQKEKAHHPMLNMFRIYGLCQTHTATGRVTMSEPNLQNIPRNFDIQLPGSFTSF